MEDVKWERNVLEGHLRTAVKECNNLDSLLSEAEDEADKMVSKIQLLEQQLGIVRDEHHQLKLNQGEKQAKLKRSMGHPRNMDEVLEQRDIAFWQSVLSAVLSLTVGMIIYEAKDANCMPLVVALYTVVGMSMKNVISFFSTIDNNPASDAVALLSFNCFILGTLTYPTLPKVVRILGSLA
ncbi:hypothetical protein LINPERHAP2_LOCUS13500 [Linum perenne]